MSSQTRYLIAIQLLEPHATVLLNEFIDPIVEDRVVIESQKGDAPLTASECNVPTDQATLLFRRYGNPLTSNRRLTETDLWVDSNPI